MATAQDSIRGLELKEALHFAQHQNMSLRSSELDISIQNKEIVSAGIRPNPVFNAQILNLLDHSHYPNEPLFISSTNRQDWFQLTKKVQLYGVRQEKIELEECRLNKSIANHNANKREVLYSVAGKWLDAWYAQVNKKMAHDAIISLDSLIQYKKAHGILQNNNEYLRLLILDDQYDIVDINAQQDLRDELNDLQFLLNSKYIQSVSKEDQLNLVDIPDDVDSILTTAMRMRSDIGVYKQQVAVSKANQTLQKSYSIPAPEVGFVVNPQNTIPYAGIFLTQPIPVFDHNQGAKQKATIMLQQARLEEEAILLRVSSEVQKSYESYKIQQQKMIKIKDALSLAAQLVSNIRKDYLRNTNSYVDLWEAERTWYETEKMYYNTEYEYRKSIIDVLYYTGMLEQL